MFQLGARSAMSWRRLSLGTRVRSLRGRPVPGCVLEKVDLNRGLQCFRGWGVISELSFVGAGFSFVGAGSFEKELKFSTW